MTRQETSLKASILIVDDNAANLLALEALLAPLEQRVVIANSGEAALKELLHHDVAVILLDVQMPGLDGFQTAALIKGRDRTRHIPIIFLTAYSKDAKHVFKGYAHGAVDYMLKPYEPDILLSKVSVFVELSLQEKKIKQQAELLRQRDLEAADRRNELQQRNLGDLMPLSLWTARPDGEVIHANRAWLDYSGITAAQSGNLGDLQSIHQEDRDRLRAAWRKAVAGERDFDGEYRLARQDGVYRWHIVRAVGERTERGAVTRWICTATDVDDLKQAEDVRGQLLVREQEARAEAEAANHAKDEFLATVSHELRTPLNAILGWVRILRTDDQGLDAASTRRALETIERNARIQKQLIEDILDVSRIITAKLRLDVTELNLALVMQVAVDAMRPAADAKGLVLEVTVPGPVPGPVHRFAGDPDRLQQVIWNLLSNAIKFSPQGGRVRVTLEESPSEVAITVRDSGRGISADFLPHVFERFRQADGSSSRSFAGLGLGLAIVRHLVELHGGSVVAESAGLDQGATFTVRLPVRTVKKSSRPPMASPPPVVPLPSGSRILDGLYVLVVDDSEDARALFKATLDRQGARTLTVSSAEEAMHALDRGLPDVLLSDIGMPTEDGYSLMRRVRATGRTMPAAALTAFARAGDMEKTLEAGFQMHIAKPIDPAELVSCVAELAGRPSGR